MLVYTCRPRRRRLAHVISRKSKKRFVPTPDIKHSGVKPIHAEEVHVRSWRCSRSLACFQNGADDPKATFEFRLRTAALRHEADVARSANLAPSRSTSTAAAQSQADIDRPALRARDSCQQPLETGIHRSGREYLMTGVTSPMLVSAKWLKLGRLAGRPRASKHSARVAGMTLVRSG